EIYRAIHRINEKPKIHSVLDMFPFQSGLSNTIPTSASAVQPGIAFPFNLPLPATTSSNIQAAQPAVVSSSNQVLPAAQPNKTLGKRKSSALIHGHNSALTKRRRVTKFSDLSLNTHTLMPSFLSLPAEVQDMVLTELLGGRTLHINGRRDQCHFLLKGECWAHYGHLAAVGNTDTNSKCLGLLPRLEYSRLQDAKVLHSCKELAEVGERIIWKTSTYTFDSPTCFARFIQKASPGQLSAIRKLRLIIDQSSTYPVTVNFSTGAGKRTLWNAVLTPENLQLFRGLRSVHVDLCMKTSIPVHLQQKYSESFLAGLTKFAPLKRNVTVEAHDGGHYGFVGLVTQNIRWTEEEREKFGKDVLELMEGKIQLPTPTA
ncbi:MAG: hypothetical protein Q9187_005484, partial [Circinaria calcarea]